MTTLRDLVFNVGDDPVIDAGARLYHQREIEWLPAAISNVLAELRRLTPQAAEGDYELHIERTEPASLSDEPVYWDVWCTKAGDSEHYGFDLSPWEEWLAVRVPAALEAAIPAPEIVAHCIWEMTFYGFTQERVAETRAELERRAREIDEGKVVAIPMEEVMARLREKFPDLPSREESAAKHARDEAPPR
jgi:hypothetical protein